MIKYQKIYDDLKNSIEQNKYKYQDFLPSENKLVDIFQCSRNTIRRAIKQLADNGYVQSIAGKGVRIIYIKDDKSEFYLSGIESLKEASIRNSKSYVTKVIQFDIIEIDDKLSKETSLPVNSKAYFIIRLREINGMPLILDYNYFLCDIVKDLTVDVAEKSIYEYMENTLSESIAITKRKMTIEKYNSFDSQYLSASDFNCLAVVRSITYNGKGELFEYTISKHRADSFSFYDQAYRNKS